MSTPLSSPPDLEESQCGSEAYPGYPCPHQHPPHPARGGSLSTWPSHPTPRGVPAQRCEADESTGWMNTREKGAQTAWGGGGSHVSLGTDEGPKGPMVLGWIPAKKAKVWAGMWSQAQAWWGEAPPAVSQQLRKPRGGISQAGHTQAWLPESLCLAHLLGHDPHQQGRDLAFVG